MNTSRLSGGQLNSLVVLRIFIGWHFLYEGVIKMYNPEWTSQGYLLSSQGFLKPFFGWLASEGMVGVTDALNIVALMFIGAALVLGILERPGVLAGIVLLGLYYLAHPAFPGMEQGITEGNYWIINKNLVEIAALGVLYFFPTSEFFGIKRLFSQKVGNTQQHTS